MSRADLLLEIGTEELPPGLLPDIAEDLGAHLLRGLEQAGLEPGPLEAFAAPRRIGVIIRGVLERQPDREERRLGPPVAAAIDASGQATPAGAGFARSCGVDFQALEQVEDAKGLRLAHTHKVSGGETRDLLADLVRSACGALSIPRRMRWGQGDEEFVRPVHWMVFLLGGEVVPAFLWNVHAGRETRGHRFHAPAPLAIAEAGSYREQLRQAGRVIASFAERRAQIAAAVEAEATRLGGHVPADAALLDEVTALVEWPVVLSGNFDRQFLDVPHEALVSTMCANQKYFPVFDDTGRLMPSFILVSNLESRQPELVVAGNERVIRPRFADAEFFYREDRRTSLSDHAQGLAGITYQDRLGNMAERCERVATAVARLAPLCDADPGEARQAARLCKADLLTLMVQEFPKLQGIMGRYYALEEGLPEAVATAIEEHYLPRHADDRLPASAIGRALSLAERIELLAGFFAIGKQPTGDKDPFGLRRAALGLIRILMESGLRLDLREAFAAAAAQLPADLAAGDVAETVLGFVMQRVEIWLHGQDVPADAVQAVAARAGSDVVDFVQRVQAIQAFLSLPEAPELAAANKRVANILAKSESGGNDAVGVDTGLLSEGVERELHAAVHAADDTIAPLLHRGDYVDALQQLARLQPLVSRYFDEVMVNCDDLRVRANRHQLLGSLRGLFLQVADISLLQGIEARS